VTIVTRASRCGYDRVLEVISSTLYLSRNMVSFSSLLVVAAVSSNFLASGTLNDCLSRFGPVPSIEICDTYPNTGDKSKLKNDKVKTKSDVLNTGFPFETPTTIAERMAGLMPNQDSNNIPANYEPVLDAFCFNEDYPVPSLTSVEQTALYFDYKRLFDKVLLPSTDLSQGITNDRFPGMYLRMCFHDNAINPDAPAFQDYVTQSIDPVTKKWIGEARYMDTSGADASHLMCPEERYHPNQNYDQTATRVLNSIQSNLKSKYKYMSYADLLHNGCNAATIYLTRQNPSTSLSRNPFTFGRKDACHKDAKCSKKYPLCGPTELLPGVGMSVKEVNNWFLARGMTSCNFMG
jgi:Peroxidase